MALIFAQSSDGETISMAAGTHTGHVLLTKHDVTFAGAGVDSTVIKADGTYTTVFQAPFPPQTGDGEPVSTVTIKDCTIDGDLLSSLASLIGSTTAAGPGEIRLRNVRLRNHHKDTIAVLNASRLVAESIEVVGNGGGIKATTASNCTFISDCTVTGGAFGFNLSDGTAGTVPGICLSGLRVRPMFWAAPTYEAVTVTGYSESGATVQSHESDHRSPYDCLRALTPLGTINIALPILANVRKWDRVETDDGTWTQVMSVSGNYATLDTWRAAGSWTPVATPEGTATVYRVALGRLYSSIATGLTISYGGFGSWRGVEGGRELPRLVDGCRLDILRHGTSDGAVAAGVRDVDDGGIHITKTARGAVLVNCHVQGGFSDMISVRGVGTEVAVCTTDLGQDMGFTVDATVGQQTLRHCKATRAGYQGFYLLGGYSELHECEAENNGLHEDGGGYAVFTESAAAGSFINVDGYRNKHGGHGGVGGARSRIDPKVESVWS